MYVKNSLFKNVLLRDVLLKIVGKNMVLLKSSLLKIVFSKWFCVRFYDFAKNEAEARKEYL